MFKCFRVEEMNIFDKMKFFEIKFKSKYTIMKVTLPSFHAHGRVSLNLRSLSDLGNRSEKIAGRGQILPVSQRQ